MSDTEFAAAAGLPDEVLSRAAGERRSKVTFELETGETLPIAA
jgi:hypothetical protein